jgi:hypothetical protein
MLFRNVEAVKKNVLFCKIVCFYEMITSQNVPSLLDCYSVFFGQILSIVLKGYPKLPRSEDENTMILQNVWDYKPNDAMSHLRRNEFFYTSFDHFSALYNCQESLQFWPVFPVLSHT